ncbi:MAG: 2-oxoacid:ferredoxin oxidoreductase subunit beta, partial [Gammaproteobacteria bacterium]
VTAKASAADNQLLLEHGKPMRFGKIDENGHQRRGLKLNMRSLELEVVTVGEGGVTEAEIMVHDETNRALATMLATMLANGGGAGFPEPLGVLYCEPGAPLECARDASWRDFPGRPLEARAARLNGLLRGGHTWTVS